VPGARVKQGDVIASSARQALTAALHFEILENGGDQPG